MNASRRIHSVPVWDAHWSTEQLRREQADNPRSFSRGFQMKAFSDDERMYPSFKSCYAHGVVVGDIARRGWPTFAGVDLAGRTRPGNVIFVGATDPLNGRRYPLEIQRGAWTSPKTASVIADINERYPSLSIIMVENNGYQQSLIDWIQSDPRGNSFWYKIESYTTGFASKVNPTFGLPSLEVEFKNQAWVIPADEFEGHPPQCQCGWCVWKEEMCDYPLGRGTDTTMACLPPGEMVTTRRGLVPIENVVEGDYVLTHRSRFRLVTGTTARGYSGDMMRVKPAGMGVPVRMTPEHPVWTATRKFDRSHLEGCESPSNRVIPSVWAFREAGELNVGRLTAGQFVFAPAPSESNAIPRIDMAGYTGPKRRYANTWTVGQDAMRYQSRKAIPRWLDIDEEMGLFLGLFLAEGSIGRHTTMAAFAFNKKETHLQRFIAKVSASRFNASSTMITATGHGGMTVAVQSAVVARFLARFGSRDSKGVPWEWWWEWPEKVRLAIVRGWLLGDGHLAGKVLTDAKHASALSISPIIIYQVQLALWVAGLTSAVSEANQPDGFGGKPCNHHRAWRLTLSSSDTAKLLDKPTPVEVEHWGDHGCVARSRTNSQALPVAGGAAVRVGGVEREHYEGMVYNLHVDEDESFVAGGIAVHNCFFFREAVAKWGGSGRGAGVAAGDLSSR